MQIKINRDRKVVSPRKLNKFNITMSCIRVLKAIAPKVSHYEGLTANVSLSASTGTLLFERVPGQPNDNMLLNYTTKHGVCRFCPDGLKAAFNGQIPRRIYLKIQ